MRGWKVGERRILGLSKKEDTFRLLNKSEKYYNFETFHQEQEVASKINTSQFLRLQLSEEFAR